MSDEPTTAPPGDEPGVSDKRQLGLEVMADVYAWEVNDGAGDFFGLTVEHLFAEIWTREGLTFRDRRLMLIGLMVGSGLDDVLGLQIDAALRKEELTEHELREIVIFLTHYAGWPRGAKLNTAVEKTIASEAKRRQAEAEAEEETTRRD